MLTTAELAEHMKVGTHGSTYGGNSAISRTMSSHFLICSASSAVVSIAPIGKPPPKDFAVLNTSGVTLQGLVGIKITSMTVTQAVRERDKHNALLIFEK